MARSNSKKRNLSGRTRVHDVTADGGASFKQIAKAIGTTEPGAVFIYNRAMRKIKQFLVAKPTLMRKLYSHLED